MLDYQFCVNVLIELLETKNPDLVLGYYGYKSELAMPNYIQPWEIIYEPNISYGIVIKISKYSNIVECTFSFACGS